MAGHGNTATQNDVRVTHRNRMFHTEAIHINGHDLMEHLPKGTTAVTRDCWDRESRTRTAEIVLRVPVVTMSNDFEFVE